MSREGVRVHPSRSLRRGGAVLVAVWLVVAQAGAASAGPGAPGTLDRSFHHTGRRSLPGISTIKDVVRQGSKVILAGVADSHKGDLAVGRLTSDGHLDRSFGGGDGWFTRDIAHRYDAATAVSVLPSGELLVVGYADDLSVSGVEGVVVKLTSDGLLDRGFGGGDGIVLTHLPSSTISFRDVAVRDDGRFVACGTLVNHLGVSEMVAVRYLPNGHLDRSFFGGIVEVVFPGQDDAVGVDVVLQAHKTVVVGYAGAGGMDSIAVARLGPRGHYDAGFDADGQALFAPTTSNVPGGAVGLAGGKIVIAGTVTTSDTDIALLRITKDGAPDPTFGGGDGLVIDDLGGSDAARALVREPNGDLLVAGFRDTDMALVRYGPKGRRDTKFGHGGIQAKSWSKETVGYAVAWSHGKATVAGASYASMAPPQPAVVERVFG
jgi:uncharacterized delta-60 repeat protein